MLWLNFSPKGNYMNIKLFLFILLVGLTACEGEHKKSHIIANIPEASGICYDTATKRLYVVSDRGTLYELTKKGKIVRKRHLGNYDLEGIACDLKNNRLLAIEEGNDNILIINQKTLNVEKKISIRRSYNGKKLLVKDKRFGLEGITLDSAGNIYVSNQSYRKYPQKDPSVIILIKDLKHKKTPILSLIDPGPKDIAGLFYKDGNIYMVSDSNDKLYRYNLKKQKIDFIVKLPKFAQEGIAFDDDNHIYFANDNGNVLKYKTKKFGLSN
jgi:uncharacterized protein YjiK